MNIDEYAKWTMTTAVYPGAGTGSLEELSYLGLGLAGEAGEVVEKIKKMVRDPGRFEDKDYHGLMQEELGDVFYYLCRICEAEGINPSVVINMSKNKLEQRKREGKIHGDGDRR